MKINLYKIYFCDLMVVGSSISLLQCIMMKNENFMKKQKKILNHPNKCKKYDYIFIVIFVTIW